MVYKAKRVAVIGAGVSGLAAAKHLKYSGFEVVVYERSSTAGGVWCVHDLFVKLEDGADAFQVV
jgi:cation diffusion facilitator CzcD-associated flavoprotein CzcO